MSEETVSSSSEMDLKRLEDEEKDRIPSNFLNTVRILGRRSTFVAGFTYYQIGRYQFVAAPNDYYLIFNTLAFVLSVMVAGGSCIYSYYLQRHETNALKYQFCTETIHFERGIARLFIFMVIFYLLGIGMIGWSHYPESHMKAVPLVFSVMGIVVFIYGFLQIVSKQLHFQTNFGAVGESNLLDHHKIVAESKYGKRNGEKYEAFVLKQCEVISGRAIFIAGLAQAGVMRFMPYPAVFEISEDRANFFLVCVTIATVFSFVGGMILIMMQIFLPDTEKEKQLAYSILLTPMIKGCFIAYLVSFFFMAASLVVNGYGTNIPDKYNECLYTSGIISTFFFGFALGKPFLNKVRIEAEESNALKEIETKEKSQNDVVMQEQEKELNDSLKGLNTAGSMSTFAAGYLYYNVVTFETDVLRLQSNATTVELKKLFLWVNVVTVSLALMSAVQDSFITLLTNDIKTVEYRLKYIKSQPRLCGLCTWFYRISLIGWFAVFGLFGVTKFNEYAYETLHYALVGIIVLLIGWAYLHMKFQKSVSIVKDMEIKNGGPLVDSEGDGSQSVAANRPALLSTIGFSVIFLGGFAYFAINFFDFRDRPREMIYLHAMSLSFIISMWVMVFADAYNNMMSTFSTTKAKRVFAHETYHFYMITVALSYLCAAALVVGFFVLGNIKSISNYKEVEPIIEFGAILAVILTLPPSIWLQYQFSAIFKHYRKDVSQSSVNQVKPESIRNVSSIHTVVGSVSVSSNHMDPEYYNRLLQQLSEEAWVAGFIAGNICYEILFSDANSSVDANNAIYFMLLNVSFACALTAVIIATVTILLFGELRSVEAKLLFAWKIKVFKLYVFLLSSGSLFFWIAACIWIGDVKYSGAYRIIWPSIVFATAGLVFLIYTMYRLKSVSDGIKKSSHKSELLAERKVENPMQNVQISTRA